MEEHKEKNAPLLSVPHFAKDFSKMSLGNEEDLIPNTTPSLGNDQNFPDHINHSPAEWPVEEQSEQEETLCLCGVCGESYTTDQFWIGCDFCETWYHGKCVKLTPARAECIKRYKCPKCHKNKRASL